MLNGMAFVNQCSWTSISLDVVGSASDKTKSRQSLARPDDLFSHFIYGLRAWVHHCSVLSPQRIRIRATGPLARRTGNGESFA